MTVEGKAFFKTSFLTPHIFEFEASVHDSIAGADTGETLISFSE